MRHFKLVSAVVILYILTVCLGFANQRIISLAPNLTEILFAIGAGKMIVGTSAYSDYPSQAKKIPIIANAGEINIEAIVAAKPTMVIAWQTGNQRIQLDELKKFNIPVYIFLFNQISDITRAMKQLGELTNNQRQADKQVEQFNAELLQLKRKIKNIKRKKVFYILWKNPLFTVGNHSLINQAIEFCGGENIFSDMEVSSPIVNISSVLARNPTIIIGGFPYHDDWKSYWKRWPQITAVKMNQLYFIDPSLLQRAGPRFVLGMQQLCNIIYESK